MNLQGLDRLHRDRVSGVMKAWKEDRPIAANELFASKGVIDTIGSRKVLLNSYDFHRVLATLPFSPVTYVVVCPLCIAPQQFVSFQKLVRSGLVMPVLSSSYEYYPEPLVEFILTVDHVSSHEYHAFRFTQIYSLSRQIVCEHCADKRFKKMLSSVQRKKGASEFRLNIERLGQSIYPFVYPDYTLIDQALAACKARDLDQVRQLVRLAESIHSIRDAQALGAPITVDEADLADVPAGVSTESDAAAGVALQVRELAAHGLGLSFPADIPLDNYLELVKDYQPAISSLIEHTAGSDVVPNTQLTQRISSLNSEIERIKGLKRYMMLEASVTFLRQHKGVVFTSILAGTLGLAGSLAGCAGTIAAGAGLKIAKKRGMLPDNLPARRLVSMIERDVQPYLNKLIAAYVGSTTTAVNLLSLRKKSEKARAA